MVARSPVSGERDPKCDPRPALFRRGPTWSVEHQRGEPERPGFNAWDERVRARQNLFAAVLVAALGIATYVVFDQLSSSSRTLACLEAGHRNCGFAVIPGNGHK